MPLPGGESDKIGNRYEGRWIVNSMIDVIDERAASVRIEPPGEEGEGIEFWLQREDAKEYHQVKRQNVQGRWTNGALNARGVLSHFLNKLRDPEAHCVFISTDRAFELDELADRAKRASSVEEFRDAFLNTEDHRKRFSVLRHYWARCSESQAFDYLRRIRVETIGERQLETFVESRITALIEGQAPAIAATLMQFALDKIGQVLTAQDLWAHLGAQGFSRRKWGEDPHVLAKVAVANQSYLDPLRKPAVGNDFIPREELAQVLGFLTTPEAKQAVMVVGDAGVGKSSVMYLVATTLTDMGWPFLAFRVDRLQPAYLPKTVGVEQLNLPASPAHVLASIAQGKNSVLIIDQLDAVSLASGRHPDFFECIAAIISEALSFPTMRVLLACRVFDLQNDHRLRQLTDDGDIAEVVALKPLSDDVVHGVLQALNLDSTQLRNDQISLLSIPLHLRLLAETIGIPESTAFDFNSVRDLYDRYWKYKQRIIRARLGRDVNWIPVIDSLCDYMSRNQVLYAPEQVVEDNNCVTDAEVMASENVLVHEQGRYVFFHETFFDYAFARRYGTKGFDLAALLLNSEQHLFRRAQVRQVLAYQRETDFASYLSALKSLLESPAIRFHLKQVIFALLHGLQEPKKKEWEIIEPFLDDDDNALAWEVWRTIRGSAPWFDLLHAQGVIKLWLLDKDNGRVNQAVQFLASIQKERPDKVADLVESFVDQSPDWNNRLIYLSRLGDLSHGRRFFDLFLKLIDRGLLDDVKGFAINSDFWSLIYSQPKANPEWACETIRHRLQRLLTIALAENVTNPFRRIAGAPGFSNSGERVILESAKGSPSAFVTHVLPFMLHVIRLNLMKSGESPLKDAVWRYRIYGESHSVEGAVLQGMEAAFQELALNEPLLFKAIAEENADLDLETIQYLLIRGYTANPKRFADEAIEYLLESPRRLETGYSQNEYWATRELIDAVTPYCSDVNLTRLEALLLNYYPSSEKDKWGYRYKRFGFAQFMLLEGIDHSRRSDKVHKRIREHRRSGKFDVNAINLQPEAMEFKRVPPPVPEKATKKMTDEQWLRAIASYPADDLARRAGLGLVGGAGQLAGLLQARAGEEPERFVGLLFQIPDNSNPTYFNSILLGIANASVEAHLLSTACKRCHELPNRPCGYAIATLISSQSRQDLPMEILNILLWYATKDPDPSPNERKVRVEGQGANHPNTILATGINSVRGRAAEAMAHLIFADPSSCDYFLNTLREMVQDPADSVKSCVAETLVAALNFDRDIAVGLFNQLCNDEEALLSTRHIERFLYYAATTHYQELEPLLVRMLNSSLDEVRTVGARQMTLASLTIEEAEYRLEASLKGAEAQQLGAAEVFAANLHSARFRDRCERALTFLFNSPHEQVQAAASQCFDRLRGDELAEYPNLANEFAKSRAYTKNYQHILRALDVTTAKLPSVTLSICEKFVTVVGAEAGNITTGAAADSDTVTRLVVRIYSQNEGHKDTQSRCLDLIDRMAKHKAIGLDKALETFER